jgi:hypothetical protein
VIHTKHYEKITALKVVWRWDGPEDNRLFPFDSPPASALARGLPQLIPVHLLEVHYGISSRRIGYQ